MADEHINCGDHVLHRPSGETWVVAAADHAANDLMWCGWPEGMGRVSDCEVIKRATPEESAELHAQLDGSRRRMADRVYGALRDDASASSEPSAP